MQNQNTFFSSLFIITYLHVCFSMRVGPWRGTGIVNELKVQTAKPTSRLASATFTRSHSDIGRPSLNSPSSPHVFVVNSFPNQDFNSFKTIKKAVPESQTLQPRELEEEIVRKDFYTAQGQRLIVLDYDGTLRDFVTDPEAAIPSPELLETLGSLALDTRNSVWIVSGRDKIFLGKHFGKIQNLGLKAEYGAATKSPASLEWEPLEFEQKMLEKFVDILKKQVASVPGSHVEEKEYGIAYHYRAPWEKETKQYEALKAKVDELRGKGSSDEDLNKFITKENPEITSYKALDEKLANIEKTYEKAAKDLKHQLEKEISAENHPLQAMIGKKVVELKSKLTNKRKALEDIYSKYPTPDFVLVAGDELADEMMFKIAEEKAKNPHTSLYTIHVSHEKTIGTSARFKVKKPDDLIRLLTSFRLRPQEEISSTNPLNPRVYLKSFSMEYPSSKVSYSHL